MNFFRLITNNIGLKIFSLALAIFTWAYVISELGRSVEEKRMELYDVFPYRMTSKYVYVKPSFVGKPVKGYVIVHDKVVVFPKQILIMGPKAIVEDLMYLKTEPINVSEYTKSFTRSVPLAPVGNFMVPKESISVTVPIEKIPEVVEPVNIQKEEGAR